MMFGTRTLLTVGICGAGMLCGAATPAWALYTYNGSTIGDTIYVGCRAGQTVICDDGALTVVENDCTLSDDVAVYAGDGNDTVTIVRSPVNPTCNGTGTTISALTYGGRFVDLYGEGGDDTLAGGTSDHDVTGGNGADAVTVYSHLGRASGEGGDDTVRAEAMMSGWEVSGGSYADCVSGPNGGDPGTLPDVFDCGSETDDYVNVDDFAETGCEGVVGDC